MVGILAEKPSAARNFAAALGGMEGIFNGEKYVIANSRGHLYEFLEPHEMVPEIDAEEYKSWDTENLPWDEGKFSWRYRRKEGASQTLKTIKDRLENCDEIVIATDVDPSGEGDLLAWEVINGLKLNKKKISRMYFADETEKEVQKAFKQRKTFANAADDRDFIKALYRSKWDLLSMQFTRAATECAGGRNVIRQGRLKSVMVKITGDGLKAVAEYKKDPKYTNRFKDENGVVYKNPSEPLFGRREDVPDKYRSSSVVKDSAQMKRTAPPKLIDLAGLSSRLAPKGVKAKDVLDVYQKMYEAKIVSYPRTEDKTVTPEQFNDLLPYVDKIARVVGVDSSLLTHRSPRSTHVKNGGAHGANRPGPVVPGSLKELEKYGACAPLIYEMLAKNYLAMLAEDYEYEAQTAHLRDYPDFKGRASVPKKAGWKAVYSDDEPKDDEENEKGVGTLAGPFVAEVVNPKPPAPTQKWLMKQLEKHDVGTGATRTSTFADVTNEKTKYPLLKETKGKITMAPCGQASYILIQGTRIADVAVTEHLMQEMRDVADGKLATADGLHKIREMVKSDLAVMKKNAAALKAQMPELAAAQKEKCTGTWNGEEVSFAREWAGHRFSDEECRKLLNGETITVSGLVSKKTGKTYAVNGKLSRQEYKGKEYVGFENLGFADAPAGQEDFLCKCPECGAGIRATGKGWFCSDKCGVAVWPEMRFYGDKIRMTDSSVKTLLEGGTIKRKVKTKNGKSYEAELKLVKEGKYMNLVKA